jgi:hypothetical protein
MPTPHNVPDFICIENDQSYLMLKKKVSDG